MVEKLTHEMLDDFNWKKQILQQIRILLKWSEVDCGVFSKMNVQVLMSDNVCQSLPEFWVQLVG